MDTDSQSSYDSEKDYLGTPLSDPEDVPWIARSDFILDHESSDDERWQWAKTTFATQLAAMDSEKEESDSDYEDRWDYDRKMMEFGYGVDENGDPVAEPEDFNHLDWPVLCRSANYYECHSDDGMRYEDSHFYDAYAPRWDHGKGEFWPDNMSNVGLPDEGLPMTVLENLKSCYGKMENFLGGYDRKDAIGVLKEMSDVLLIWLQESNPLQVGLCPSISLCVF